MKGAFSTPVCARKQTNGPPGIDQGFSTGSCNRRHALSARAVHPPTSSCPKRRTYFQNGLRQLITWKVSSVVKGLTSSPLLQDSILQNLPYTATMAKYNNYIYRLKKSHTELWRVVGLHQTKLSIPFQVLKD